VHQSKGGDEWPDASLYAGGSLEPQDYNLGAGVGAADLDGGVDDDDDGGGSDGAFEMRGLGDELPPGRQAAACTPLLGLAALPADRGGGAGGDGGGRIKRVAPATTPRGEGGALEQTPRGEKKKQPRPAGGGEGQAADAGERGDEGSIGGADERHEESDGADDGDEDYTSESEGEE
jgi:hypothetical protein